MVAALVHPNKSTKIIYSCLASIVLINRPKRKKIPMETIQHVATHATHDNATI